ncbi:MAG: hypothetical protein MK214_15680 [Thalassotalea sp.]|nr:hypothetical protein [Thalassotalea sp.]
MRIVYSVFISALVCLLPSKSVKASSDNAWLPVVVYNLLDDSPESPVVPPNTRPVWDDYSLYASNSENGVTLNWTEQEGISSYLVQYHYGDGQWISVENSTTSYTLPTDQTGSIEYRVIGCVSAGACDDFSNELAINIDNNSSLPSVFSVPKFIVSGEPFSVYWSRIDNAKIYEVELSANNDAEYGLVYSGDGLNGGELAEYRSQSLADGSYCFRIRVINQDDVVSSYSNSVCTTVGTRTLDQIETVTVTELAAGEYELSWPDIPYAESYKVERETFTASSSAEALKQQSVARAKGTALNGTVGDGQLVSQNGTTGKLAWQSISEQADNSLKQTHKLDTFDLNGEQRYRISACDNQNNCTETVSAFYTVPAGNAVAAKTSNISATEVDASTVKLNWTEVEHADTYTVKMWRIGSSWERLFPNIQGNEFIKGISLAGEYKFSVSACIDEGFCANSVELQGVATFTLGANPVTVPQFFSVPEYTKPNGKVDISWKAPLSGTVDKYEVQGELKGAFYKDSTLVPDSDGYYHLIRNAESEGRQYCYKARAWFTNGTKGDFTGTECTTVGESTFPAVNSFSFTKTSAQEYSISWDPVEGASKYLLELQTRGEPYTNLWQAIEYNAETSHSLQFSDYHKDIFNSVGHFGFRVSACREDGVCGNHTRVYYSIMTDGDYIDSPLPAHMAPSCLAVPSQVAAGENINVSWCQPQHSGVVGYSVIGELRSEFLTGSIGDFDKDIQHLDKITRPPLPEGREYCYRIKANYSNGESAETETACVVVDHIAFEAPPKMDSEPTYESFNNYNLGWSSMNGASTYLLEQQVDIGVWQQRSCNVSNLNVNGSALVGCNFTFTAEDEIAAYGEVIFRVSACTSANECGNYQRHKLVIQPLPTVFKTDDNNLYIDVGNKFVHLTNTNGTWEIAELTQTEWDALTLIATDYSVEFDDYSGNEEQDIRLTSSDGNTVLTLGRNNGVYDSVISNSEASPDTPVEPETAGFSPSEARGEEIGLTAGQFKVDESGAAAYSIPLSLPEGIAGVTPSLSLNYHSSAPNGPLGKGWSVGGLSAISRCRQTDETDGDNQPLTLTNNDRFCLDGQKLIAVSGLYGEAGTEYRTEIDSQTRVFSYGSAGNGPAYFTVEKADGSISYYGNQDIDTTRTDSSFALADETLITWNVSSISDNYRNTQNSIYFYYETGSESSTNIGLNEQVISQVSYSGNNVYFNYYDVSARSDLTKLFVHGIPVQANALLDNVSVANHDEIVVRSYHLDYEQDSTTNTERISDIQECGLNSVCLPATSFAWHNQELPSFAYTSDDIDLGSGTIQAQQSFDLDGNGFSDIAYVMKSSGHYSLYVSYNSEGSLASPIKLASFAIDDDEPVKLVPLDIDGDSHMEIVFYKSYAGKNEWVSYDLDDGTIETIQDECTGLIITEDNYIRYLNIDTQTTGTGVMFHDVNADAYPDMVYRQNNENYVALNNRQGGFDNAIAVDIELPNAGEHTSYSSSAASFASKSSSSWARLEEDAEYIESLPLDEAIEKYGIEPQGQAKQGVQGRANGGFNARQAICGDYLCSTEVRTLETDLPPVDFNGDGVADLLLKVADVYKPKLDYRQTEIRLYWAAFALLEVDGAYRYEFIAKVPNSDHEIDYSTENRLFVTDANGDGLGDVVSRSVASSASNWSLYLSTGEGFEVSKTIFMLDAAGDSISVNDIQSLQFIDVDGNGQADAFYFNEDKEAWQVNYQTLDGFSDSETLKYDTSFNKDTDFVFIGDWDGDGNIGLARVETNNQRLIYTADNVNNGVNVPANTIHTIINGFGLDTVIDYKQLTDSTVYTKGNDAEDLAYGNSSPIFDVIAPQYVVSQVTSDVPSYSAPGVFSSTNTVAVSYHYEGLRIQSGGRGSLGFERLSTTDMQTRFVTTTSYHQDFPFIGMPIKTVTSNDVGQTISEAVNHWEVYLLNDGVINSPYLHQSTERSNDIDSPSELLTTTVTTNVYEPFDDSYTNLTSVEVETYQGYETTAFNTITTTNSYDDDDESKWRIGRISGSTVLQERPNAFPDAQSHISRSSSFSYHENGMLKTEHINGLTTLHCYEATYGREIETTTYAGLTSVLDCGDALVSTSSDLDKVYRTKRSIFGDSNDGRYLTRVTDGVNVRQTILSRNALGQPTQTSDVNNVNTYINYDAFGRQYFVNTDGGLKTTISRATDSSFDGSMYVETVESAGKPTTRAYFNALGQQIASATQNIDGKYIYRESHYDQLGRVIRESIPYQGANQDWNDMFYDDFGRLTKTIQANGVTSDITYEGFLTTTVVTPNDGWADIQTKAETTNVLGETVSVVDNAAALAGSSIRYYYNAVGDLTKVIGIDNVEIVNSYSSYGHKLSTNDTSKWLWSYTYNALGELSTQTSANGYVTKIYRDKFGRTVSKHTTGSGVNDNVKYSFSNNGEGHQLVSESNDEQSISYFYDDLGRVNLTQTEIDNTTYGQQVTFDEFGRIFQQFDADSTSIVGCFDASQNVVGHCRGVQHHYKNGHLFKQTEAREGANGRVYMQVNAKDSFGNVTQFVQNQGTTGEISTIKAFNNVTGLLESISANNGTIQSNSYQFDQLGNLRTRTNNTLATVGRGYSETFKYDTVNRLTDVIDETGTRDSLTVKYAQNGNIKYKSDVGYYCYNDARPHAVSGLGDEDCTEQDYQYDNNGNMTQGLNRTIDYSHFDKAVLITNNADNSVTSFNYGTNRSRYKRVTTEVVDNEEVTTTTYYIGNIEVVSQSNSNVITTRRALPGAIELVRSNGTSEVNFLLKDHLGSIDTIVNENGYVKQKVYFDAWGKKHQVDLGNVNIITEQYAQLTLHQLLDITTRGYTGHESVDHAGIIHMNGRIYDPTLGRFLQADPHIQAPTNSQNYNRYSYVLNNPLSYTDPSGYFFKKLGKFIKKHWRTIASIAIAVYLPGASFMSGFGPVASGAITGFVAGGVATGSLKGALVGAFTGAMFGGIHDGFAGKVMTTGMKVGKTLLHGMAGGIGSVLAGGKFGHGFVAAGFTQAVSQGGDVFVDGDRLGNAIKAAAIGGTASAITGGKFANGAITGAFSRVLNDDAVSRSLPSDTSDSDRNTIASEIYDDAESRAKQLLKWQADENWDAVRSEYSALSSVSDNQMSLYVDNYVQEFRTQMLGNVASVTVAPLATGAEKALTVGTSIAFDRSPKNILESLVGAFLPSPPPIMKHQFIYTRSKIDVGFVRR